MSKEVPNENTLPADPRRSTIISEKIGELPTSHKDSSIGIFKTEINNAEGFLAFKPKNSKESDQEWLLRLRGSSLEHQLNHDWQEWEKKWTEPDEPWFGELDAEFIASGGHPQKEFPRYRQYILDNIGARETKQLGNFGWWAEKAGILDRELLNKIAREFLED